MNDSNHLSQSEVIEYSGICYPEISDEYRSITNKKDVILSCQGSNILLKDDDKSNLQIISVINIAYNISPEFVYNDKRLGYVLIWNNLLNPKIRPISANEDFFNYIQTMVESVPIGNRENEITLHIDKIWSEVVTSDYCKSIKDFLANFFKEIRYSKSIIISGDAPRLIVIFTIYVSKIFSNNISYIDKNNELVNITKLI